MNLLSFLEQWVNPSGWIKVYCESDYIMAKTLVETGVIHSWSDLSEHKSAQYTFNPRESTYFVLLPKELQKCKVTHFVVTGPGMIVFTDLKKNLK